MVASRRQLGELEPGLEGHGVGQAQPVTHHLDQTRLLGATRRQIDPENADPFGDQGPRDRVGPGVRTPRIPAGGREREQQGNRRLAYLEHRGRQRPGRRHAGIARQDGYQFTAGSCHVAWPTDDQIGRVGRHGGCQPQQQRRQADGGTDLGGRRHDPGEEQGSEGPDEHDSQDDRRQQHPLAGHDVQTLHQPQGRMRGLLGSVAGTLGHRWSTLPPTTATNAHLAPPAYPIAGSGTTRARAAAAASAAPSTPCEARARCTAHSSAGGARSAARASSSRSPRTTPANRLPLATWKRDADR